MKGIRDVPLIPHGIKNTVAFNCLPPVCLVGRVRQEVFIGNLFHQDRVDDDAVSRIVEDHALFYPIGYLEVGATLSISPKDAALPVFEGETQYTHLSKLFMGTSVELRCKVNLFQSYDQEDMQGLKEVWGYISNRGTDKYFNLARFDVVGYWFDKLALNTIHQSNYIYLFSLLHYVNDRNFYHITIFNPRVSSPKRIFPISGSTSTMEFEVYSEGLGYVISNFPRVCDVFYSNLSKEVGFALYSRRMIRSVHHFIGGHYYNESYEPWSLAFGRMICVPNADEMGFKYKPGSESGNLMSTVIVGRYVAFNPIMVYSCRVNGELARDTRTIYDYIGG